MRSWLPLDRLDQKNVCEDTTFEPKDAVMGRAEERVFWPRKYQRQKGQALSGERPYSQCTEKPAEVSQQSETGSELCF